MAPTIINDTFADLSDWSFADLPGCLIGRIGGSLAEEAVKVGHKLPVKAVNEQPRSRPVITANFIAGPWRSVARPSWRVGNALYSCESSKTVTSKRKSIENVMSLRGRGAWVDENTDLHTIMDFNGISILKREVCHTPEADPFEAD